MEGVGLEGGVTNSLGSGGREGSSSELCTPGSLATMNTVFHPGDDHWRIAPGP